MSKKGVFGIACLVGLISLVAALLADGSFVRVTNGALNRPWSTLLGFFCGLFVYSIMSLAVLLDCKKLVRTRIFAISLGKSAIFALIFTPLLIFLAKIESEMGFPFFDGTVAPKVWHASEHWFVIIFVFQLCLCVGISGAFNPKSYIAKKTNSAAAASK